jgi:hypothetical protein
MWIRLFLALACLLNLPTAAQAPDAETVWQTVEAAGLPRELVELRYASGFPQVAVIGRRMPDATVSLGGVFMGGRYLAPHPATAEVFSQLDEPQALAWVSQVLLAFERPFLSLPDELEGTGVYEAPQVVTDGNSIRVRLWVGDAAAKEYSLRQYVLSATGYRVTVQKRWKRS